MAKLTDKLFNRVIEGKFVADSGDELPKELPAVSAVDNGKALVVSGGKWVAGTISGGTQLYKHSINITGKNDESQDVAINLVCYSANNASVSGTYTSGMALLNEFINMISIRTLAEELYNSFVSLHVSTYDEFEVEYKDRSGTIFMVFNFDNEQTASVVDVTTPL